MSAFKNYMVIGVMDVAGNISTGCFIVDDIINNFIVIRSSPYERMGSGMKV